MGEAKRQLELLGINTTRDLRSIVRDVAKDIENNDSSHKQTSENNLYQEQHQKQSNDLSIATTSQSSSSSSSSSQPWMVTASNLITSIFGVDFILGAMRFARHIILFSTSMTVRGIHAVSSAGIVTIPQYWESWAEEHRTAANQAERLSLTSDWVDGLFDVHGHQIFELGLFNADPHPGNILVIDQDEEEFHLKQENKEDYHINKISNNNTNNTIMRNESRENHRQHYHHEQQNHLYRRNMLGLIDYGQCKKLNKEEQIRIANLILSVANDDDGNRNDNNIHNLNDNHIHPNDEIIAKRFRELGIQTKNDSTKFLAEFARLMFGPLRPMHLQHSWHKKFHEM